MVGSVVREATGQGAGAGALGPFELGSVIGSGGMGVVWLARHRAQGVPVAIKVIEHRLAQEERYHAAFRHEVRAVASLEHPGIVGVYDYGQVPADHGVLPAGSPYLVMEYVEHGSLDLLRDRMSWPLLRHVALGVLDALAHAHARGIVHRDMKPGNVLLSQQADGVLGVKLTDFGVAHALGAEGDEDVIYASAGTLDYMPPEQSQGQWRDFGPWTDLYAVGCMLWELVTGRPPYEGNAPFALILQHYQAPVPRLSARFEVPLELEGWLRRLLQKAPEGRYVSAADAAWALRQLGAREEAPSRFSSVWPTLKNARSTSRTPTLLWGDAASAQAEAQAEVAWGHATTMALETMGVEASGLLEALAWRDRDAEDGPLSPPGQRPPWEPGWRRSSSGEAQHKPLTGAGLGLYGLRELPLVGRVSERDAIWAALGEVSASGQPRALVVRGPSGVGKSRLVEWMAVRAQELGQATWMRASYGPLGGPAEGMSRMIANYVQGNGMERAKLYGHMVNACKRLAPDLEEGVRAARAAALCELLSPARGGAPSRQTMEVPRVRLEQEQERFEVIAQFLSMASARRPVVVWLDDVMWGAEALGFVRWALTRRDVGDALPVLFLLTAREELLPERPIEGRALSALSSVARVGTLEVGPLPEAAHYALVSELLGLDAGLVAEIAARTQGNPLFAVQLVGDWVERGLLELRGQGLQLVAGAEVSLPDDLHTLWRGRIERLEALPLYGMSGEQVACALELAAALGQEVDLGEWREVCVQEQIPVSPAVVEGLLSQRLVLGTPTGFAFVHGMLRESLERLASERGRLAGNHRACAQLLRSRYGEHAQGHAERVAQHLTLAGDFAGALLPLLDASYQHQLAGQYDRAERVLAEHGRLSARLGLGAEDVRVMRAGMQRAWLGWSRGGAQGEAAEAEAAALEALARRLGHDDVLGEALRLRGLVARFGGALEESLTVLEQALACFERVGDAEGAARAALSVAVALRELGRLEEAEALLIDAVRRAEASDLYILLPRCFGNLAEVSLQAGDLVKARERFERARQSAEAVGDRKGVAFAVQGLGDLALSRGEWAASREWYGKAEAIFAAAGSRYVEDVRLNIAVALVLEERYAQAEARVQTLGKSRGAFQDALGHVIVVACAAARSDWAGWDSGLAKAAAALSRTDVWRRALELVGAHAAGLARSMGEGGRADELERLLLQE
jgi:serine/threonine protein kinase/tetratricopeptide (TPR) repeat protein